jgi:hypothetical protein
LSKRRTKKLKLTQNSASQFNRRSIALLLISITVVVLLYFAWPRSNPLSQTGGVTIVDSFYSYSPRFTDELVEYLTERGLKVDVYKDNDVTVDFYRELPKRSNSILLLRVHAGTLKNTSTLPTYMFTTEK